MRCKMRNLLSRVANSSCTDIPTKRIDPQKLNNNSSWTRSLCPRLCPPRHDRLFKLFLDPTRGGQNVDRICSCRILPGEYLEIVNFSISMYVYSYTTLVALEISYRQLFPPLLPRIYLISEGEISDFCQVTQRNNALCILSSLSLLYKLSKKMNYFSRVQLWE